MQPMVHRIELPTGIGIHQLGSLLRRANFFPANATKIVLSFHPKKTFLDPLGIALLASWGSYCRERGVGIQCENLQSPGLLYAHRMGLFESLQVKYPKVVEAHEGAGRFVALTRVATQDELSLLCAEMGGVLKVPHLIKCAQYTLSEMVRNTIEHAGAAAFVCAQYYEKDKRVTIGVADCGRGIKESLSANYCFQDDATALLAALMPRVTGAKRHMYGAPDNAGLGLYYARGMSKASGRSFVLLSGNVAYKQRAKQKSAVPTHNPAEESHESLSGLFPWQGTAVGVNVRGIDVNMDTFMARMDRAVNIGRQMARRPRINFT